MQNKHGAHQRVESLGHSKTVSSSDGSVPGGKRIHWFVVGKCAGARVTAAEGHRDGGRAKEEVLRIDAFQTSLAAASGLLE
jgi:hypothetical protein